MTNIQIYRAKKIDSDEYVEGYYVFEEYSEKHIILQNNRLGYFRNYIDPSTLAMSFNGGVTWRTLEEVHNGLSFLDAPTILTNKDN